MNPYETIRYPGRPIAHTHPDRLAAMGILFGMEPVPIERARVLEIGCCDGINLLALAQSLPGSEFVGIDITESDIARAQESLVAVGLRNIEFHRMDLCDLPGPFEKFDYVIVHGLYSWIPLDVRERLMGAVQESLAPRGIAYISYNVLPGCHFRQMFREMMLFHARNVVDTEERIDKARELLTFMALSLEGHQQKLMFQHQLGIFAQEKDYALFHDDLAEHYHPVHFHEFAAHSARYGLKYLAEASYFAMRPEALGSGAAALFSNNIGQFTNDPVEASQYLDFSYCRHFRMTLVCHEAAHVEHIVRADRLRALHFHTQSTFAGTMDGEDLFEGAHECKIRTSDRNVLSLMHFLIDIWPRVVSFRELPGAESDPERTCEILLALMNLGMVEPAVFCPEFTLVPSERPTASALARLQASRGWPLANLRHVGVQTSNPVQNLLIPLLDGTRTREMLLDELAPIPPALLDAALASIAGLCLLVS